MVDSERVSNTMLLRQIGDIALQITQLCQVMSEVKAMLQNVEERVRKLENSDAGAHPLLQSQIKTAFERLEEHDKRLVRLTDAVIRLEQSNRILTWVGGILGSTALIWLITQILGALK